MDESMDSSMNEGDIVIIPSLEDLALKVSYKEILGNLILCHDHRPKEKKLNWLNCSSLLSTIPYLESEQLLEIVRSRLDQHLVGTMGDTIRKKCVKKFHWSVTEYSWQPDTDCGEDVGSKERKEDCVVDLWAFLDCVLDESFEDLETYIAFPGCEPNEKLIATIAKRSPFLKKLKLDFSVMKKGTKPKILSPLILPLLSLEHLTDLSLRLCKFDEKLRPTLLSLIGKSCPLLSRLEVEIDSVIKKEDVLAICMGELACDMNSSEGSNECEWLQDDEFSRLKVPEKLLTPVCFTLKELSLYWSTFGRVTDDGSSDKFSVSYCAVFILRHLPLLEKLHMPFGECCSAIEHLHQQSRSQLKFEKAALRHYKGPPNINSKNLGCSLSLTSLVGINALDKEMLQTVAFWCPLLKEAYIYNPCALKPASPNGSPSDEDLSEYFLSPDKLEAILRSWPKLTKLRIQGFKVNYVTSILKVFGAELKELNFSARSEFSMHNLLACPKLESLCIRSYGADDCSKLVDSGPPFSQATTFLPHLKVFKSDICLGRWSYLFENKSNLTSLSLLCCHIGYQVDDGLSVDRPRKRLKSSTGACLNPSGWNQIPKLWPRMEDLEIGWCPGLTAGMLTNLLPQFNKLKDISFPSELQWKEPFLARTVIEQLLRRKPPIQLEFCKYYDTKCSYA